MSRVPFAFPPLLSPHAAQAIGNASFEVWRHSPQFLRAFHDLPAPADWHIASWEGLCDNYTLFGGDGNPSVLRACIHGALSRGRAPKAHVCMVWFFF